MASGHAYRSLQKMAKAAADKGLEVPGCQPRSMMKILHGFFASGQCVPAVALKEALEGKAEVLTPDLPMHPKEAIGYPDEQPEAKPRDASKVKFIK